MSDRPGPVAPASDYDQHYAAGGFGYEERRDHWLAWARRHYVDAFGLKTGRLLDVGCGDGFWTSVFRELGFEATGVDLSPAESRPHGRATRGSRSSLAMRTQPFRSSPARSTSSSVARSATSGKRISRPPGSPR